MHEFRIQPFEHQLTYLKEHAALEGWCLFWEQGTAKTKPIIDSACQLYRDGEINGLLVVAPNGVHLNWVTDELPKHLQRDVERKTFAHAWSTRKAKHVATQAAVRQLLNHDGLSILTITYDAFMTQAGKQLVWKFLQKRKVLFVLDESHRIKSPGAKRTKSVLAAGKYGVKRRVLTGTPIAVGPFDVYSQVKFVDSTFWERNGFGSFAAYKAHYGVWEKGWTMVGGEGREFDKCIGYRNLDHLYELLKKISTRYTKDEVLDLPPKLFSKRRFEMNADQWRHYEELRRDYITFLEQGGMVEAPLAITRMIRWQQITSGFLPGEDGNLQRLGNTNPRLEQMEDIRDQLSGQGIVWSRWTDDVNELMDLLGDRAVRYDGRISPEEAARNKERFQKGEVDWFVGNQMMTPEGLTLHMAKTTVYYANTHRLIDRLQSEDRNHRAGMDDQPVNYIDLIANNTIDEAILENLMNKVEIASVITGDKLRAWL